MKLNPDAELQAAIGALNQMRYWLREAEAERVYYSQSLIRMEVPRLAVDSCRTLITTLHRTVRFSQSPRLYSRCADIPHPLLRSLLLSQDCLVQFRFVMMH